MAKFEVHHQGKTIIACNSLTLCGLARKRYARKHGVSMEAIGLKVRGKMGLALTQGEVCKQGLRVA